MKHVEMKVVDEDGNEVPDGEVGEALFRSRSVMQGYYGQPDLTDEAFTPDGWLRTGDLMMRDADGYYYVRSRKKDMIKSGGENVFVARWRTCCARTPPSTTASCSARATR